MKSRLFSQSAIRWGGRDNTHIITPNGDVEFMGRQLKNPKRPDRADDRPFHMNVVMNGVSAWLLYFLILDRTHVDHAKAWFS